MAKIDIAEGIQRYGDALIKSLKDRGCIISKWIPCKEQMPDNGVNVIVCLKNKSIAYCYYEADLDRFYVVDSDYWYFARSVTHWMKTPDSP